MDSITLDLKLAFREAGCPICRIRQEAERRYLFHLLYEGMYDPSTWAHLVHGMGLCHEHAWVLQVTAQQRFASGAGVAMLYTNLARRVRNTLSENLAGNLWARERKQARLRNWLEGRGALARGLARLLPASDAAQVVISSLSPSAGCRVCSVVGESQTTHLRSLARHMVDPEFRAWYAESDGLCLPHLRTALALARSQDSARHLLEATLARVDTLVMNLEEFVRKHSWSNRQEPKHPWEQTSWLRAVAFFAGEAPPTEGSEVDQLRQKALADYRVPIVLQTKIPPQ